MLSYTFSTREKILLVLLGGGLLIVAWYQFIFLNIQREIASVDTQIAATQDQITVYQQQAIKLENMRKAVNDFEGEGVKPIILPDFDNTQPLMAYLHSVLGSTQSYDMTFSNPGLSEDDGTVHRSGTIKYITSSYEESRSVSEQIAHGPYACQVDALSIKEGGTKKKDANAASTFTTTLQVTFFENPPADKDIAAEDKSPEGQDLSALTQIKKK